MANKIQETKLTLGTFVNNGSMLRQVDRGEQQVEFMYDEFCKGRCVEMTLTSEKFINAPDLHIVFSNAQLKKILKFLIESEKK